MALQCYRRRIEWQRRNERKNPINAYAPPFRLKADIDREEEIVKQSLLYLIYSFYIKFAENSIEFD